MGGKKYVFLLAGILGFFALTARRIPPHQAGLYVALFFLGGCVSVMGDLIAFIPRSFYFHLFVFPAGFLRLHRLGKHHAFCRGKRDVLGDFFIYAGPLWNQGNFQGGQTVAGGGLHFLLHAGSFWGIPFDVAGLRAAFCDSIFPGRPAPHQAAADFCLCRGCWPR